MYEVYLITNTVNGKRYVGITKNGYLHRFREHVSSANNNSHNLIHAAIRKYGEISFTVELIESNVSDEIAGDREQYYIRLYDTYYINRKGYNMTIGGNGTIGYVFTDEVKHRMSIANSGRIYSDERNQRIREKMIGRDYKDKWKLALSEARKGRFAGAENPFYGKHHSDGTRNLIGENNTKYRAIRCDPRTHEELQTYRSVLDAARWVVESRLSKAAPDTCNARIHLVARQGSGHTAYGYEWILKPKCID